MNSSDQITIKSTNISKALDDNGFSIIPSFLNTVNGKALEDFFNGTITESRVDADFFTTHWSPEIVYRQKVNAYVKQLCEPLLANVFSNYKCILGYFLYKRNSPDSAIGIHQDWTLFDESKYRGFIIWIPLTDTTITNGCFHLVPGSHKKYPNIRGSHIEQNFSRDLTDEVIPVPVASNDALVLDSRLIHSSPPNFSTLGRLAVGMVIVPTQAQLLHYYYNRKSGYVEQFEVKDTFLVDSFYDYKHQLGDDYILSYIEKDQALKNETSIQGGCLTGKV